MRILALTILFFFALVVVGTAQAEFKLTFTFSSGETERRTVMVENLVEELEKFVLGNRDGKVAIVSSHGGDYLVTKSQNEITFKEPFEPARTSSAEEFLEELYDDRAEGQLTGCSSNLKNIATAIEMYSVDWEGELPERLNQLQPNYLQTIPTCYAKGASIYVYSLQGGSYWLSCKRDHSRLNCPKGYPRYNPDEGLIERP